MLTCLYHPIDDPITVDEEDAEKLLASGVWFDSPVKAKAYRDKVEQEIKDESKPKKAKAQKSLGEKDNEKSSHGK